MQWTISMEAPHMINHAGVSLDNDIYYIADFMDSISMQVLRTETLQWALPTHKDNDDCLISHQPTMVFQRYRHSVFAHNGRVYKWGCPNFQCNILHCFDPKARSWTLPKVTGNIPLARDGHSSCVVGNCLYIYGGYLTSEIHVHADHVSCLNFETMEWTEVPTTGEQPAKRGFHSAVVMDDRMYIFGGLCHHPMLSRLPEKLFCAKIYYLDLKTRVWHCPKNTGGDIPLGRHSHVMFTYKGIIYLFGGVNEDLHMHLNDLNAYDPISNCWRVLTPYGKPPQARRLHDSTMMGSKMYLFGGVNEKNTFSDLHVLDFLPSLQTLSMASAVESGRSLEMLPYEMQKQIRSMMQPL